MPGSALSILCTLSNSIPSTTLWHRNSYYPHFIDKEAEVQELATATWLTITIWLCCLPYFCLCGPLVTVCLTVLKDAMRVSASELSAATALFFKQCLLQLLSCQSHPGQAAAFCSCHLHNRSVFNTEGLRRLLKVNM